MSKQNIQTSDDVTALLLDTLTKIQNKQISNDEVEAISKISDKVIKNSLVQVMYKKVSQHNRPIAYLEGKPSK